MVWPASGVVVAILLLRPRREWWGILVVFFLLDASVRFLIGCSISVSLGMAIFNITGPAAAAWVMMLLCHDRVTFTRLADMLALVFVAAFVDAAVIALGAIVPVIGFRDTYLDVWTIWWISSGLGILAVTPFLVIWVKSRPFLVKRSPSETLEIVVWFVLLGLSALAGLLHCAKQGESMTDFQVLPIDATARKATPVYSGLVRYFPLALVAVAELSRIGNEQHNPGKPLHWDRSKSQDELDALMRHLMEAGKVDTDGVLHSTKVAWRALANLQKELEAARVPAVRV